MSTQIALPVAPGMQTTKAQAMGSGAIAFRRFLQELFEIPWRDDEQIDFWLTNIRGSNPGLLVNVFAKKVYEIVRDVFSSKRIIHYVMRDEEEQMMFAAVVAVFVCLLKAIGENSLSWGISSFYFDNAAVFFSSMSFDKKILNEIQHEIQQFSKHSIMVALENSKVTIFRATAWMDE